MSENVIVRHRDEGRTLLVGGSDFVTYKVTPAESRDTYFCFEVEATPGYGPPMHKHGYPELFYVLDGEYEFTVGDDGEVRVVVGKPGSSVGVNPGVPHTFRAIGDAPARMLNVQFAEFLVGFFEEFGVPVERAGEVPEGLTAPDFQAMGAALARHGVEIVAAQPTR